MTGMGLLTCITIAVALIATGTAGLRADTGKPTSPALVALNLVGDAAHVGVILAGVAVLIIAIAQPLGGTQ